MITRAKVSAYICLRCPHRLALPTRRVRPAETPYARRFLNVRHQHNSIPNSSETSGLLDEQSETEDDVLSSLPSRAEEAEGERIGQGSDTHGGNIGAKDTLVADSSVEDGLGIGIDAHRFTVADAPHETQLSGASKRRLSEEKEEAMLDEHYQRPIHESRIPIRRQYIGVPEDPAEWYSSTRTDKVASLRTGYKLYGYHGAVQREKLDEDKFSSLGKAAEVIVLKGGRTRYMYPRPRMVEPEEPSERVDLLAMINAERGIIGDAQVNQNIDSLRPETKRELTWGEFQVIEKELNEGFTVMQLTKYVAAHPRPPKANCGDESGSSINLEPASELERRINLDAIVHTIHQISAWMPGVSDSGESFDSSVLRGYISDASFTQKQKLVVLLMRQCWGLEVDEVVESLGEIEMLLSKPTIEILIKGKNSALKSIGNTYFKSREDQIEVYRGRGVIRVTAQKENASAIVKAIRIATASIQTLHVDMSVLKPTTKPHVKNPQSFVSKEDLQELENLTDTVVEVLDNDKIIISGSRTSNQGQDGNVLSKAEIARRLLLSAADLAFRKTGEVALKATKGSLIALRYEEKYNMPWRQKARCWARWVSGVERETEGIPESNSPKLTPQQDRKRGLDIHTTRIPEVALTLKNLNDYIAWNTAMFTTSFVTLGHVLHETPSDGPAASFLTTKPTPQNTYFLPKSRNLLHLLNKAEASDSNHPPRPRASVRMKFLPSPWSIEGRNALETYPPVQMHFSINELTKELVLEDISAVVEMRTSEVMLPDRAMDLQFSQRKTSKLRTLYHHQLQSVVKFLESSQLNISKGPLLTPPSLDLPISDFLYKQGLQAVDADAPAVTVEYMFAGLEFRNTFTTSFQGWTMLYTSINAGKADGQRSELTLHPARIVAAENTTYDSPQQLQDQNSEDYITAAYDLVDALEDVDAPINIRRIMSASNMPVVTSNKPVVTYVRSGGHKSFEPFSNPINFDSRGWTDGGGLEE